MSTDSNESRHVRSRMTALWHWLMPRVNTSDDWDQRLLKERRWWYDLALLLLLVSIFTRQPLPLLAALLVFLIGIVPEIWFRYALRHLLVHQQVNHRHLFFGEQVILSLSVENRKKLPLPWLRLENTITPPLTVLSAQETALQKVPHERHISIWLLWSYQRVTQKIRLTCSVRGLHVFGPLKLRCSDPFGWLERDVSLAAREALVVYPLLAPLEDLGLPSRFPIGESIGPRQLLEDPLWFAGLREYQQGDDPRRIDWKATARAGELRSKMYESTTERRLLILLDTWISTRTIDHTERELQEFCISAAASLAVWTLDAGYMVGILTNSASATITSTFNRAVSTDDPEREEDEDITLSVSGVSVPYALNDAHSMDILTTLACLVPTVHTSLEQVIEREYSLFAQSSTVLVLGIRDTLSLDLLDLLHERRRQGCAIVLVLVGEQETEDDFPDVEGFSLYYLGGKEKWHELTRSLNDRADAPAGTSSARLQLA